MSRLLLTFLILVLPAGAVLCQQNKKPAHPPAKEATRTVQSVPESVAPGDTLSAPATQDADTAAINQYTPLWESDTVVLGRDSVRLYDQVPRVEGDTAVYIADTDHFPSRAVMLALALPGLGQAYNKKYWKIPIVWAAFAGAGYAIWFNGREYRLASEEFAQNPGDDFSRRKLDYWKRYLEISYISLIGVYALQVVDAYVDAQLFYWDVNENLSMKMTPSVQPLMASSGFTGTVYGLTCSFTFKGK